MVPGFEYLSSLRLTKIIQQTADLRQLPQELLFIQRVPKVPASDGELMGRWTGRVLIADLISDDSRALTYASGKMTIESTANPNIKHGRHMTQEQVNQLLSIGGNPGLPASDFAGMAMPNEIIGNVIPNIIDTLQLGIEQRREALSVAMHIDAVTYDRFGVKMSGSWGIPADLKVTPLVPWTDAANATPVNDIWNVKRNASVRWGKKYNRATMSTAAFLAMIATTEFQNKARSSLPLYFDYPNIPTGDMDFQENVAKNILGLKQLVLYDARYWSQDSEGVDTAAPYLPLNKVILDAVENDGNRTVHDFSDGIVTESVLSNLLPNTGTGVIGGLGQGVRGPVCYATVPHDLNPPNLTIWGVSRGFPRKFQLQANAVLTVGNIVDTIPVTELP